MPYIKAKDRKKLDMTIDLLSDKIETGGEFNYVISRLAIDFSKQLGNNYKAFSDAISTMECAKLEFYRKCVAPYEDIKEKENGKL